MLSLAGREVAMQPLVFDLLVYLVERRSRVVSKDELLGALWPGLNVTENSLQRAVSILRGILREGGMERTLRNFPRAGYRFCADRDNTEDRQSSTRTPAQSALEATREQRWSDAARLFSEADAEQLSAGDLESWSHALHCLGRPADAIPLLTRAAAIHARSGEPERSAHAAISLSTIHLERGEMAVAKGWLARAGGLLDHADDCATQGELYWMRARIAATEGDARGALDLADAAYEAGRRHGDVRIESLGLMYRGFYRLSVGETRAGLADQDHAAARALSQKVDPVTGGVLYCNILWACRSSGDWARANEWTLGYQDFCSNNRMGFSGSCRLHRAECLGVQESLPEAREQILSSIALLPDDAPWALGDGYRVLGDIEAAIGNEGAAAAAYEKCYSLGWDAEPGHAWTLIEKGQFLAACASLERSLIGRTWWTLQRQGILNAHLAIASALSGQAERAATLIAGLSDDEAAPSVKALVLEASAVLDSQRGDATGALARLHAARRIWTGIGSRIHAARLRLKVAEVQFEIGDPEGARDEILAARAAADSLGSRKLARQCEALLSVVH